MPNRIICTRDWKKAALDLKATVFNAGHIALNTNEAFTPNYASVRGDITEPADGTYARETPAYGAATDYGPGDAQIVAAPVTFTFAHDAGDFTIYHACQLNAAAELLWVFELDAPVTITAPGPWQFVPVFADGDY